MRKEREKERVEKQLVRKGEEREGEAVQLCTKIKNRIYL